MKYIAKIEKGSPILFFPEERARSGFLVCWTILDGHNEACADYFKGLKNPSDADAQRLSDVVRFYELLPPGPSGLVRVWRDSEKKRLKRHYAEL